MSTKGMSRKEIFEKAKLERQRERENSQSGSFTSGAGTEGAVYAALSPEMGRVVRLYGNPLVVRDQPTDPKLVFISFILGDNGKKFRCVWPDKNSQPDWILWKIYDLVASFSMKGYGEERERVYNYKRSHPECWRRVVKNNNEENRFEQGWRPTGHVVMNIIDRHDPEYHEKTKRSKLLSKKASEMSSGDFWYEAGIPITAYNAIFDNVVEFYGPWQEYDISVKKLKDKPWYTAYHALEEAIKLSPAEKKVTVEGPMTEEEENYELYDIDQLFRVTSYTRIKATLARFIRKVDTDFDTNFSEELEKLVEEEQKKWKEEQEKQEKDEPKKAPSKKKVEEEEVEYEADEAVVDDDEESFDEEEVVEGVKERPKKKSAEIRTRTPKREVAKEEIPWDKLADGSYNGTEYLGVPEMTDEEKEMVVRVKTDGSFEYVKEWKGEEVELLKSTVTDFNSPAQFHVDPLSGEIFDEE